MILEPASNRQHQLQGLVQPYRSMIPTNFDPEVVLWLNEGFSQPWPAVIVNITIYTIWKFGNEFRDQRNRTVRSEHLQEFVSHSNNAFLAMKTSQQ